MLAKRVVHNNTALGRVLRVLRRFFTSEVLLGRVLRSRL